MPPGFLAPLGSAPAAPAPAVPLRMLGFFPRDIDDPLFRLQWYLPALGVPAAWRVAAGRPFAPVLVAVLDTGLDASHPDLAGRAILGPSFVAGTRTSQDDNGHGSSVAGIIGALPGNGIGIAPVAPEVRVLGIKVLDSRGAGTVAEVIAGLDAARAAGARVVNMSFGTRRHSVALDVAIGRALAAGMILVASAGNDGADSAEYPAAIPGVLAVGAVDARGARAATSSGGPAVRLAAPGVDIVSLGRNGRYSFASGTSQAAPQVAGAIATLLAFQPVLSGTEAADLLFATGRSTGGFGSAGTVRVDLREALAGALRR